MSNVRIYIHTKSRNNISKHHAAAAAVGMAGVDISQCLNAAAFWGHLIRFWREKERKKILWPLSWAQMIKIKNNLLLDLICDKRVINVERNRPIKKTLRIDKKDKKKSFRYWQIVIIMSWCVYVLLLSFFNEHFFI